MEEKNKRKEIGMKKAMTVQTLVSAVNENTAALAEKMNLCSDAIIINQCIREKTKRNEQPKNPCAAVYEEYEYKGHRIECYQFCEKGVGLSRNNALMRATADIILFADDDIVYLDGYDDMLREAFAKHPKADMLLFNMDVAKERATYHTQKEKAVHWYNCGRYPTYSFALRREKLHRLGITFSLLFGGGAKYSNGEDSIFIRECIQKGMKVYALPITIGREMPRPSTWFTGYHEKFFFDRGVLYQHLYGNMARLFALRFLIRHRETLFVPADGDTSQKITMMQAYALMKQGMKEMR